MVRRSSDAVFKKLGSVVEKRKKEGPFLHKKKIKSRKKDAKEFKKLMAHVKAYTKQVKKSAGLFRGLKIKTKKLRPKISSSPVLPEKKYVPAGPQKTEKEVFRQLEIRNVSQPSAKPSLLSTFLKKAKGQQTKKKVELKLISDLSRPKKEGFKKESIGLPSLKPVVKTEQAESRKIEEKAGEIFVETIMTKNPVSVDINEPVERALEIIVSYNIRGVPVTEDGKLVGIVEEEELLGYFGKKMPVTEGSIKEHPGEIDTLSSRPIKEILTKTPVVLSPHDSLDTAVKKMNEKKVGRLCVVENGNLIGILTRDDVIKAIIKSATSYHSITSEVIRTDIDRLLELVEKEGKITTERASEILGIDKETVTNWANILESHGLLKKEYPMFGTIELVKKET